MPEFSTLLVVGIISLVIASVVSIAFGRKHYCDGGSLDGAIASGVLTFLGVSIVLFVFYFPLSFFVAILISFATP